MSSPDSPSMVDDSLVDVEAHIREIEHYLTGETAAQVASGHQDGPSPLLALAAEPPPRRGQQSGAASGTPAPVGSYSSASTPASLGQTSASASYAVASISTPARIALDLSSTTSASRLSTPSTVSTLRSETAQSARSHASRSTAASSQPSNADKDRLVQQLLLQHRQAQSTASAHARPVAASAPPPVPRPAPQPVPPMRSSSASIGRDQRDALVERLLEERRRKKDEIAPIPAPAPAHAWGESRQQQPARDSRPAAPVRHPHFEDDEHDSSLTSNHSLDQSATPSQSALSPSMHSYRSHSGVNSPLDPRFMGAAQTIFDASEWLNEDGTSIVHDESDRDLPGSHSPEHQTNDDGDYSRSQESIDGSFEQQQTSAATSPSAISHASSFAPARAQQFSTAASSATGRHTQLPPSTTVAPPAAGRPSRPATAGARGRSTSRVRTRSPSVPGAARVSSRTRAQQTVPSVAAQPSSARSSSAVRRASSSSAAASTVQVAASTTSRYSKAAIIASIERERAEAFTFAPTLVSKPLLATNATLEDRLQAWTARAAANQARQLEARKEYEEKKLAECTFAPKINSNAPVRSADPIEGALRLHHEADARVRVREKARRMNEEEVLATLPFTPQITEASRRVASQGPAGQQKPLYQRVGELQRARNEKLHALLLDARQGEGNEATFVPKINTTSLKLAKEKKRKEAELQRQEEEDAAAATSPTAEAADRLSQSASTRALSKKLHAAHLVAMEMSREYTFRPEVNATSQRMVQTSRVFQGANSDFLTRQARQAEAARAEQYEREQLARKGHAATHSFSPDIGNAEAILLAAQKRLGLVPQDAQAAAEETPQQQAQRMSATEAKSLTLLKSKLARMHLAKDGCTFKPEISRVSRTLAAQRSEAFAQVGTDESTARAQAALLLQEKIDREFKAVHTFKPAMNAASQEMAQAGLVEAHYGHTTNDCKRVANQIAADAAARELKMQEAARAKEAAELEGCTFAPVVASVPKQAKAPVLVKGMNRFLQLKALHLRQEAEQRARERKVFLLADDPTDEPAARRPPLAPFTVAQPFSLSHEQRAPQRDAARERAQAAAEAHRMRECSFAPLTKQAQNRAMIQSILNEPEDDAGTASVD